VFNFILYFFFSILILLINFNIVIINDESIGCVKSIKSDEENESTEVIDNKVIITSKANDIKSLTENMKECNINNSTNFNELSTSKDKEKSNDSCMSLQSKKKKTKLNNKTNKNCNIVNVINISTKINEVNLETQNSFTNLNNILVNKNKIKFEKEINQFYQNIKSEIEKFNDFNNQSSIKHIAHLEIEASKKKELEQIVAEFESERINSPDPFLFIAELKTFIHEFVDFDNFKCDH